MSNKFLRTFFCILLGLLSIKAGAAPNVLGSFSGTLSGTTPFKNGGTDGSPTTQNVSISVTNQNGASISGSISLSPAGLSTTFTGSVDAAGNINALFAPSPTVLGVNGFTGVFNGSSLTIPTGAGSLVIADTAVNITDYDIAGTLAFSGGQIINPITAPSTSIKDAGTIRTEVLGVTAPIQQHLVKTLHGSAKGIDFNKQGFVIEGEGGLNAGSMQLGNIGVWASYNYREVENDFSRTAFESTNHMGLLGIDYSLINT